MIHIGKKFGDNVKRYRRRADLTQGEVADLADMHDTALSLIERGFRQPRADSVAKIAGALGVDPGDLFEGIEWRPDELGYGRFMPEAGERET